jgi:hypothetical protein
MRSPKRQARALPAAVFAPLAPHLPPDGYGGVFVHRGVAVQVAFERANFETGSSLDRFQGLKPGAFQAMKANFEIGFSLDRFKG